MKVQAQSGLLAGFPVPVTNVGGQWSPGIVQSYASVVSQLTGECLDRAGTPNMPGTRIDTWDCVDDHHNEMYRWDNISGLLYVASTDPGIPDLCVSMGPGCPASGTPSACEQPCDASSANQTFVFVPADKTWRLKTDSTRCVTASASPTEDAGITLTPCSSPPSKAQQWVYEPVTVPNGPLDWGRCFGPVNLLLA